MKFYGVWVGRKTGVFDNWDECSKQVLKYKDPVYQKLNAKNLEDAEIEFKLGFKGKAPKSTSSKDKKESVSVSKNKIDLQNDNSVVFFCDGACKTNPGASASGVSLYKHGVLTNLYYGSYKVDGSNNIGELEAFIFCLEKIKEEDYFSATVFVDSMYVINSITKWAKSWSKNNWMTKDDKPVKNLELIQKAFLLYESLSHAVIVKKVKAHSNSEGNELADRMAIFGSNEKEKNWFNFRDLNVNEILKIKHN